MSSKFGTNGCLDSRMNQSEFEWSKVKFTVVKHLVKNAFFTSQLFNVLAQEKQLDLVHGGVQQGGTFYLLDDGAKTGSVLKKHNMEKAMDGWTEIDRWINR